MMQTHNGAGSTFQNQLQARKNDLEKAKQQLKTEFFGLDQVIDQVIDQVSSWYCFPTLQEKPVVINLWGMTGTGKSSLINRLVKLIGFENAHYHFDMGEIANARSKMNIYNQLSDTEYREPDEPFIISLDEFQHARSLDEKGSEKVKPEERIVWQILDDGTYEVDEAESMALDRIKKVTNMLREAIQKGVVTQKGYIIKNKSVWENILHNYLEFAQLPGLRDDKEKIINEAKMDRPKLIPRALLGYMADFDFYRPDDLLQFEQDLTHMNTQQTLELFVEIKQKAIQPSTVDCTHSLIFVIGNLDEAYPMHQNHHPDMDADHLHRLSSNIGITDIKAALQKRFRSEEIARLGNNHIIYPALRKQDFQAIIQQEMERVKTRLEEKTGIAITMEASLLTLLFEEGVYPAQGTRPVFTTIHQLIYPLVMDALLQPGAALDTIDQIALKYEHPDLTARIYRLDGASQQPKIVSRRQPFSLNSSRESKGDDYQAIRAVHEAGHAIGSIFLEGVIPELICSKTADNSNSGFTHIQRGQKVVSKRNLRNQIAAKLGGYAAELQVFGEEHVTNGSGRDIEEVTKTLTTLFREYGMGTFPAYFCRSGPELNNSLKDDGEIDQEVRSWIEACLERIQATLKKQATLLLQIAAYLTDHTRMEKELIREYCHHFGRDFDEAQLINGATFGYRAQLLALMEEKEKAVDGIKG